MHRWRLIELIELTEKHEVVSIIRKCKEITYSNCCSKSKKMNSSDDIFSLLLISEKLPQQRQELEVNKNSLSGDAKESSTENLKKKILQDLRELLREIDETNWMFEK